jgi:3-deoxy-D-manno-octulosonate 8-phosphate phosphatase (KDO 8-P phosphatase)
MSEAIPVDVAKAIRLVIFDVDGVLTDGGVYLGATEDGRKVEMKRFEITDQLGIKMLVWAGIDVVLVSGRESSANHQRAEELGIPCYEGPGGQKLAIVERLIEERSISWRETACVCDDLADVPIFRRARLPAAVANAVPEVRACALWTTTRHGGHGAAREFAEALLRARGEWNRRVEDYLRQHDTQVPA